MLALLRSYFGVGSNLGEAKNVLKEIYWKVDNNRWLSPKTRHAYRFVLAWQVSAKMTNRMTKAARHGQEEESCTAWSASKGLRR
jgi:hypothetical protein